MGLFISFLSLFSSRARYHSVYSGMSSTIEIEDPIDLREFVSNPRKFASEMLFQTYGFDEKKEPIDADWKVSKVLKKCVSDASINRLIPEINHSDAKLGIESVPKGKLC